MSTTVTHGETAHDLPQTGATPQEAATAVSPVIDSGTLFSNRKEVHIRHGGQVYRLLLTRNDKLILNK